MWQKLTLTAFWPWNIQYHGKFRCICRKMSKINHLLLVYRSLLLVLAFLSPYPCIQRQISAQMMEKACESLVSWRGIPWPNFFLHKNLVWSPWRIIVVSAVLVVQDVFWGERIYLERTARDSREPVSWSYISKSNYTALYAVNSRHAKLKDYLSKTQNQYIPTEIR